MNVSSRCPRIILGLAFLAFLLAAPSRAADAPASGPIDWDRARALHQREARGETLSADEQAYLDRAKAEVAKGNGPNRDNPNAQRPPTGGKDSTGLVPLTQLRGDAKYKGMDGGLYGGGSNEPPEPLKQAAAEAAKQVAPLDAAGKPSPDGKIGLMSIGMSNTTMEFSAFQRLADEGPRKNPKLVIVDAAQGGKDAAAWAKGAGAGNPVWDEADRRIKAAGLSAAQVQVVWIKQALAGPARYGDFPAHADALRKDVETILATARSRYPNLRLAYLSSRIYAGYAASALNPEPYAYEGAFAMRGVIEDQLKAGEGPAVVWGPYLWADGVKGREGDDLVYTRQDLGADGTHPSAAGRQKVARLLLHFFQTDPTAAPWFVGPKTEGGEGGNGSANGRE